MADRSLIFYISSQRQEEPQRWLSCPVPAQALSHALLPPQAWLGRDQLQRHTCASAAPDCCPEAELLEGNGWPLHRTSLPHCCLEHLVTRDSAQPSPFP